MRESIFTEVVRSLNHVVRGEWVFYRFSTTNYFQDLRGTLEGEVHPC